MNQEQLALEEVRQFIAGEVSVRELKMKDGIQHLELVSKDQKQKMVFRRNYPIKVKRKGEQ